MQYVFIDTEGSVNVKSGLKTFGFVVTDENFAILREKEVYIDLNRDGSRHVNSDIKSERHFNTVYCILRDYLTAQDSYVIGFSVYNDVKNIDQACERYKTPPLSFDFFDVQGLYKRLFPDTKQFTLASCVQALGIDSEFKYHLSLEDARATMKLMQEICKRHNMTVAQFIEQYPEFTGHTQMYMAKFQVADITHTIEHSSAELFKIRLDFPLLCFKKKIGALLDNGSRDGVCYYYDVAMDKLYPDRHPHKAAKVQEFTPVYAQLGRLKALGMRKLRKEASTFYYATEPLTVKRFFVSYECVGSINDGTLTILFGNDYLTRISNKNKYVDMLSRNEVNPYNIIQTFYNAESFEQTMRKNAKWNYGDKDPAIVLDAVCVEEVQLQQEDRLYLPRAYAGVLTGKFGNNEIIACLNEHRQFASAQKVLDIDSLHLDDKCIKLIVKDANGVYGYIPTTRKVQFPMFDCVYELPFIVRRRMPNDFFDKYYM
ncbi:MAG: hypothetical protein J1G02_01020 [Clostridiales bacterium]|nr:hypothetical protein [Clostridiales bacterium]